jgi:hypothetical protein
MGNVPNPQAFTHVNGGLGLQGLGTLAICKPKLTLTCLQTLHMQPTPYTHRTICASCDE